MMKRRNFLLAAGAMLAGVQGSSLSWAVAPGNGQGTVMTVLGPISSDQLGMTLTHEHVLVDFIGADQVSPDRYNADEAYKAIIPYLQRIKGLGCQSFIECTPAYIGRDVKLLQRLANASGLYILTNTGYYGAANDKFLPKHAFAESADQLADRWLMEWTDGIEGTGIRPGFIKIGVDSGALSDIDAKLVHAAATTSKNSGLTIASHTGDTQAAMEQLDILQKEGIHPACFIWVHAQNDWKLDQRVTAAKMGAWISIDNIALDTIPFIVERLLEMKAVGVLNKVLLSHDAGWYSPGEPKGGAFRSFDTLFTTCIPAMKKTGFSEEEIHQILIANPRNAFTIGGQALRSKSK